mgnify:CR=1 FL=1
MKTVKLWIAVNKNQSIVMFSEEPKRNEKFGKWEFVKNHHLAGIWLLYIIKKDASAK